MIPGLRSSRSAPAARACGHWAGIDLAEQRRTEEVSARDRSDETDVADIESTLVVDVGVVDTDLRPSVEVEIVVLVREGLEARQPVLPSAETASRNLSEPTIRAVVT